MYTECVDGAFLFLERFGEWDTAPLDGMALLFHRVAKIIPVQGGLSNRCVHAFVCTTAVLSCGFVQACESVAATMHQTPPNDLV